jgi:hypothetical protein
VILKGSDSRNRFAIKSFEATIITSENVLSSKLSVYIVMYLGTQVFYAFIISEMGYPRWSCTLKFAYFRGNFNRLSRLRRGSGIDAQ